MSAALGGAKEKKGSARKSGKGAASAGTEKKTAVRSAVAKEGAKPAFVPATTGKTAVVMRHDPGKVRVAPTVDFKPSEKKG
jgi:hypothetical protein